MGRIALQYFRRYNLSYTHHTHQIPLRRMFNYGVGESRCADLFYTKMYLRNLNIDRGDRWL